MGELLAAAEYRALASGLTLPTRAFIDGAFVSASSGRTFATLNPATGEKLADIAACDAVDVDAAVSAARTAFDDGRWSRRNPGERKAALLRLAVLMEENAKQLAVMESLDSGKTIFDCETVDVPETIHVLRWHAELIDKIYDQVSPASDNHIAMIVREPVGVVGLVLPWNFPLLMLAWKIAPALAAGCTVVLKPAAETSLTALRVAELAAEAGIPAGVLNIVTGRRFLHYSADSNLKEVVLELGGKNPCVVLDDAEDLDAVAAHVVNGAFWNMGENCSVASRLIVQAGVKDQLLKRVSAQAAEWRAGDPLDPANRVGALVSAAHFQKVRSYLDEAASGKIAFGGKVLSDGVVEPTVVEVDACSRLSREEVFGPILSVITVDSFEEAIRVANDTDYGLAASIFSANGKRALRGARMLRAGTVTVNSFGEGDITTPFGGYKQSGFGGRDNSIHAHDQYTQLKTIWVDLTENGES